jgi:hypothetical protein
MSHLTAANTYRHYAVVVGLQQIQRNQERLVMITSDRWLRASSVRSSPAPV